MQGKGWSRGIRGEVHARKGEKKQAHMRISRPTYAAVRHGPQHQVKVKAAVMESPGSG